MASFANARQIISIRKKVGGNNVIIKRIGTYETGGIIVFDSFGITKGLKNRVCLEQLCFQFTLHGQNSAKVKTST